MSASGYLYYRDQQHSFREQARNQLTALADSKAAQIAQWLQERRGDGRMATSNALMLPLLRQVALGTAGKATLDGTRAWLGGFIETYGYEQAAVLDTAGATRASAGDGATAPLPPDLLAQVLKSRTVVLQDLHVLPSGRISLGLVTALRDSRTALAFGVLSLQIDPTRFLFPAVRSWPNESPTAEAVLIRRDGGDALLLNNTRHRAGTALQLRVPLTRLNVPAARAALGEEFVMTGPDYRGVPSVAVSRRVPGSPWTLVAKVDENEIELPLRHQLTLLSVSLASVLAASALLAVFVWRRRYAHLLARREEAEAESLRLRNSYDNLSRHANDIVVLGDETLHLVEVNERACTTYGYSREELLRMNLRDLRDPACVRDIERKARILFDQAGASYETRHRRRDGSTFPVEVSTRSFQIAGKPVFQDIVRDISDRRNLEYQLRGTNERLRTFIDSAPVGIAALDPAGIITLWNPAAERISGYSAATVIGRHHLDSPGFLGPLFLGPSTTPQDLIRARGDGESIVISISTAPLGNEHGDPAGDIVMFTDVTKHWQAEAAIRRRDQYLEGLFTAAPTAIFSLDIQSHVVTWNRGAESLFGWTADEVAGRRLPTIPDELQAEARGIQARLLAGEVIRGFESRRQRKDGSVFHSTTDASPLRDDQGAIVGLIAFIQDITARKLAEQALIESETKFRTLFEEAGDAIVIHDAGGRILELNQAACALMGASHDALLGRTPPYLAASVESADGRFFFESVHRHTDGSLTAIEVHTSRFTFNGQPAALSLIRDVSSRKRAEENLRQANESLRTIIQTSPAAIISRDTSARVLTWNRGAELLFGWTAAEAIGTTLPYGEEREGGLERLRAIGARIASGEPTSGFDQKLDHRDGTPLRISSSTAPLHDPSGNVAGEIAIGLDVTAQHDAISSLRKSESRFRTVFDQSAAGMTLCDVEGRFRHVNDRFCQISGYTASELQGKAANEITHPADRAVESEWMSRLRRGEIEKYSLEERYVRADRSVVWVYVSVSLMHDPDGRPTELFGVVEDISARKEAESSRQLLADTISASHEEIYLFDAETLRFRFVNQSALDNLGYSPEQIAQLTALDITVGFTPESLDAYLQQLLSAEVPVLIVESHNRRADGTRYPVEIHLQVFAHIESQILLAIAQDTTARHRAEQILRESEARFRQVVECAPEAIYIQTGGVIRYLNPNALKLFGAGSQEDLLGHSIFERIHPDSHSIARERSSDLNLKRRAVPWVEEKHLRLDGTMFHTEVSAVPFVHEGQPGALVFFHDITERKRRNEEHERLEGMLRQAQKMESIGRLAGGVAHDFNNHLTVINGFSELVLEQIGSNSPYTQSLREVRKAGERAAALTRQLLAFSRKQILDPHPLDLNALIRDLSNMLRRLLREDVELSTDLAPGLGAILADSDQMSQVVMNLCINSRDAMPQGGKITVRTSPSLTSSRAPAVRLSISDTGTGIDGATLPKIFEPFFTTKDVGTGTGLGLSTVHGIVEQSNGAIRVESTLGVGTTFHLDFPTVAGAIPATSHAADQPSGGSETILLVEDQYEVRLLAREILTRQGYHVLEAANGDEALALCAQTSGLISLLITDVIMPGCSGPELARRFAAVRPGTPILFMSGYDAGVLEANAAHIAKPFSPSALAAKVRKILDTQPAALLPRSATPSPRVPQT